MSKSLARFFRQQQLYLGFAVAIYASLWAIGEPPRLRTVLIYTFSLANMGGFVMERFGRRHVEEKAWRFWSSAVSLLVALTPLLVAVSTILVFWADPRPNGGRFQFASFHPLFWRYLETSWKFPAVANVMFGIGILMKTYLECRNQKLQTVVDLQSAERQKQDSDLERAREIQQGLLPKELPAVPGYDLAGVWEPARTVGGDYFDLIRFSENRLGVCIADVVGKGVAAALLMANVQAALRAFASETASPSWVCSRVNSVLCANIATGKFVTLFYGVLDSERNLLRYCNAGHLRPLLISETGATRQLDDNSALLGVFPDWKFKDSVLELDAGDRLVLYTDGITEAARPDGEEFGEDRLIASAQGLKSCPAAEFKQQLLAQVKQFCDFQLSDDATLIVIDALGRTQGRHGREFHEAGAVSAA